ncbi:hypothetical protein SAMN05421833_111194 [Microbispora rosea]|uniref:Uncharacterized protein n=1 Tax=Microbispora rosea TaxID=58117 RepID=A0A1N7CCK4_9ACTN|nr:hypothetical protein [Microbispora rosea]GIH48377.1 hypothetical protein Mro03_35560 [Microbispora rosea subsp. rosea]SIR61302.1 hypothetical protein SAMN05421833_111194 [Microbispora rosea]
MQPIRLTPAQKMMASAVLVGVVIVGGASVTAAAFAGRLDDVAKVGDAPAAKLGPASHGRSVEVSPDAPRQGDVTRARSTPEVDPDVVLKELTDDPDGVADYWTQERIQGANPMPMPQVSVSIVPD